MTMCETKTKTKALAYGKEMCKRFRIPSLILRIRYAISIFYYK